VFSVKVYFIILREEAITSQSVGEATLCSWTTMGSRVRCD